MILSHFVPDICSFHSRYYFASLMILIVTKNIFSERNHIAEGKYHD